MKLLGNVRVFVDIDFYEFYGIFGFVDNMFDYWVQLLVWVVLGCLEINEDWDFFGWFDNICYEILVGGVFDEIVCVSGIWIVQCGYGLVLFVLVFKWC